MNSHRIPKPDVSILAAICILLFCLEAAVLNYEHVYKATPDYSVRVLNRAIQSDDEETVTALVDDKAIAAGLFDGMASRGGGIDSLPVLQLAWAPLRDDFITDSSRLFHLTMQKEKDDADRAGAAENVRLRLQALGFPFPVSGWHYVSSRYAHKTDSSHAHMTVTLYNERLDRNLTCTIELTRTGPKQWRITGLADAPAFISEINDAWDQRLAAYNRPIQRQLDGLIKIRNVSATLVKGSNHQTFLRITYTPVFEGKPEEIREIRGVYELQRSGDHAVLYSGTLRLTPAASGKPHTSQFLLNPLIPSQYALMSRENLDDTRSQLRVMSVTRQDGTTLSLAEKLPN
ncbi:MULTISPECIES: hypothetical protein [unclassified Megasphaera]|uniref:hypothetical protein n=1 Tax=unclassified Megasphaera TaxID=2626256 RepID=UPI000EE865F0|nr:hypothetical protein [Megasphaera sp. UBA4233]HAM05200.1 hypothetical protein [Megasphaera sp.]